MRLEGKIALVTGAGRGIGRAIALTFASEGARVALVARTVPEIEETAQLIRHAGGQALPLSGDISLPREVDRVVTEVERCWGLVDVLVNNAGIQGPIGSVTQADPAAWLQTLGVNLYAPFLLCRRILPAMIKSRRGKIINMSGGGATSPRPFFSAYASSKAGIVSFTETLAEEVKGYNIQVNAIAPGAVPTRMTEEVLAAGAAAGEKELQGAKELLEKGSASAEKAVALAVFLASDESDGLTGRLISAVWDDWTSWRGKLAQLPTEAGTLRRMPLGKPDEEKSASPKAVKGYRGWPGGVDPDTSERVSMVVKLLRGRRAKRFLDIGCGNGKVTLRIAEAVKAEEVHGVDIASEAVTEARNNGVQAAQADIDGDPLPYPSDYFDLVVAGEVLEHVFDPGNLLAEAYRVLVPGGHLILTTPNLGSWYNRLALLFGFQPWLTSATLHNPSAGKLNWGGFLTRVGTIGGDHLRVVTLKALRGVAIAHGFSPVKFYAVSPLQLAGRQPSVPLLLLVSLFQKTWGSIPSLSSTLLVDLVADKKPEMTRKK